MTSSSFSRRSAIFWSFRAGLLSCLLLFCSGCGQSAYEAKLASEQNLIAEFDKEERVLGNPVELPDPGAGKAVDVFFRPPKEISAKSEEAKTASRVIQKDSVFREVYLAVAADMDRDAFRDKILSSFPGSKAVGVKKFDRPGRESIEYAFWTDLANANPDPKLFYRYPRFVPPDQQPTFSPPRKPGETPPALPSSDFIYFYEGPKIDGHFYLAAIVFRVEQEKAKAAEAIIGQSLRSLSVGPSAAKLRQVFRPRQTPKTQAGPR